MARPMRRFVDKVAQFSLTHAASGSLGLTDGLGKEIGAHGLFDLA